MKLLIATPCEKVLQDPESGHSLIAVFHEIKIQISQDAPEIPGNALIPKEWAVFSKFELKPDEEGKEYSLKMEVFWPDGTLLVGNQVAAAQPTKNGMAFVIKMQGFPIGQPGVIRMNQTLTTNGKPVYGPTELTARVVVERSLPPITQ
jgi:hypothetical protein